VNLVSNDPAADLMLATQTSLSRGASSKTTARTITAHWLHQMRPDLTFSAAASFSVQDGNAGFGGPGNTTSAAASIGLQYQISDTLSASLRHSFFNRQSSNSAFSFYQNMLILGISKSF
jgi:hypothetical protein